jgi:hypothetical protein
LIHLYFKKILLLQKVITSIWVVCASLEEKTASMEEITSTNNRLGALAEQLKEKLLI